MSASVRKDPPIQKGWSTPLQSRLATLILVAVYAAAPDPAAAWKARFVKDSAVLAYRTSVVWYDCGN